MVVPKKVLVVDDHRDLRELLGKAIGLIGWQTILARSGADAIDKLECHAPDVIFLDIRMPVMSGLELAAIIKKHPVHNKIPILAASGDPGHRARIADLDHGIDVRAAAKTAISE